METKRINIADLEKNVGQIEGLPVNPRQWTRTEIDRIAKSLRETPELFEARPIIAVYHNGKYVILGGNLRYEGARANKAQDVPCVVVPEDMPIAKMKEIVIKDNGTFGQWDFDELANNWDDLPLVDWGVPAWNAEEETAQPSPEQNAEEDEFDEDKDEIHVLCAKGDIWQLGEHRLMCGDSVDLEQVKKLMGGA